MSANISFTIHEQEYYHEEDIQIDQEYYDDNAQIEFLFEQHNRQYYNNNNTQSNNFIELLELFLLMEPILNVLDPLEIAIQNSENDLCLHRNENITLNLTCQPYDTTNKQYDSCSICTDNFDKEDVAVLNCGHIYHPPCIKEWGKYKPNCPICKADITFYHYISDLDEPD
jgi:hypothetical protein